MRDCYLMATAKGRAKIMMPQGPFFVTFESVSFPGVFLRMNPNGVDQPIPSGGGTVNGQFGAGQLERFKLHVISDDVGDVTMNLESAARLGAFVRISSAALNNVARIDGVVNCQFGAGQLEELHFKGQIDGNNVFRGSIVGNPTESFFNGILQLDGTGLTAPSASGGGKVNLSIDALPLTELRMTIVP